MLYVSVLGDSLLGTVELLLSLTSSSFVSSSSELEAKSLDSEPGGLITSAHRLLHARVLSSPFRYLLLQR